MNEVVVVLYFLAIVGMIGFSEVKSYKENKAFEAAQDVIKKQIADLETKLASLKK